MGEPLNTPAVNGEKVQSHFLDHLTSYPIVSDSIATFKGNPYGAKSLQYADQGYNNLAKPLLPYLSKPYGYVAPYLATADSLGDQGLSRIDSRFPLVKEKTDKIKGTVYSNLQVPWKYVEDVKNHVLDVYGQESRNHGGGSGVAASGRAAVVAGLVLSQESLAWVSSFLQSKKEQLKNAVPEKTTAAN